MKKPVLALTLCALISTGSVFAAQPPRDNFYWLGQINKASDVINTDEGLLTPEEGHALPKASTRSSGMETCPVQQDPIM